MYICVYILLGIPTESGSERDNIQSQDEAYIISDATVTFLSTKTILVTRHHLPKLTHGVLLKHKLKQKVFNWLNHERSDRFKACSMSCVLSNECPGPNLKGELPQDPPHSRHLAI